jgi:hypothetical protein
VFEQILAPDAGILTFVTTEWLSDDCEAVCSAMALEVLIMAILSASPSKLRRSSLSRDYPDRAAKINEYASARDELARILFPDHRSITDLVDRNGRQKKRIVITWNKIRHLEQEHFLNQPMFGESNITAPIESLANSLPEDSALLLYSFFSPPELGEWFSVKRKSDWSRGRYGAFLVFGKHPERSRIIDLGAEAEIDDAMAQYMARKSDPNKIDDSASRRLSELILAKVLAAISSVSNLLISTQGSFEKVQLGELPVRGKQKLKDVINVEEYTLDPSLIAA